MTRLLALFILFSCSTVEVAKNFTKGSFLIKPNEFMLINNFDQEQAFTSKVLSTTNANIESKIIILKSTCKENIKIATNNCEQFAPSKDCRIVFLAKPQLELKKSCEYTLGDQQGYTSTITFTPKS